MRVNEIFRFTLPVGNTTTSLIINEGESIAVVGENGSGKTDLLDLIYTRGKGVVYRGIVSKFTHSEEMLYESEISYAGDRLCCDPRVDVRAIVEDTAVKLAEIPERVMEAFHISTRDLDMRVKELDVITRSKLSLMVALAERKKILIVDDVLGLDYELKSSLVPFIKEMRDRYGMTLVLATVDVAMAGALSEWLIVMDAKQVVEYGRTCEIMSSPKHPYTRWIMDSAFLRGDHSTRFVRTMSDPHPKKKACKYANICPSVDDECRNAPPTFEKYSPSCWTACHRVKA